MSIQDLAALGELVGAIAVVASLLYVGKQLRQSNAMSRSEIRNELSSQANSWATSIASSPSLAEAMAKTHFHDLTREDATETERIQIAYIYVGIVGQIHMAYEQMQEGFLSTDELDEYFGAQTPLLNLPYLRSLWPLLSTNYPQDFQHWFESRHGLRADRSDESGSPEINNENAD